MPSAVRLRERTIRLRSFGHWPGGRGRSTRAGGFCRWLRSEMEWTEARRRRSAAWTARRCVTGCIGSTSRVRRASSTTGLKVPSLAFRRRAATGSVQRRSSRPWARIVRRMASCAEAGLDLKRVIAERFGVEFCFHPRYARKAFAEARLLPTSSARGPVIQRRTSGIVEAFKKLSVRAEGSSRRVAGDDAGRNLV